MKTVGEVRVWLKENLKSAFTADELPEILFLVLHFVTRLSRTQLHAFPEKELTEDQIEMLLLSVKKLQNGMPVQYALGETEFFGLRFEVDPSVLIPRPETEELVSWVLELKGNTSGDERSGERAEGEGLKGEGEKGKGERGKEERGTGKGGKGKGGKEERRKEVAENAEGGTGNAELATGNRQLVTVHRQPATEKTILDIGTGSGCIPIAIKKNWPEAAVFALDISAEALQTARRNALLNQVEVGFFQQDMLNFYPIKEARQYSIIVSNPPYVTPSEKKPMQANVLDFEPHLALFVPETDPLLFYRAIANFASLMLEKNGLLFLEVNENFGQETVKLLQEKGFSPIELKKDFRGKDRMVKAVKNW